MNPLIWRFMGGVTVATAVDLVIPGYTRILFAGIGAALPEGSKKAGVRFGVQRGLESIGKLEWNILTSPKYLGRFGVRTLPRMAVRFIPVLGWAWMGAEVSWWLLRQPGMIPMLVDDFDLDNYYGPMDPGMGYSGPNFPI